MGSHQLPEVTPEADGADDVLRACLGAADGARLRVSGRCMEPALRPGEVVILASTSKRPPRPGDIVLVRLQDGLRLHRLLWPWAREPSRVRTKADRHTEWDAPVSRGAILATVVAVEAGGRRRAPARLRPAIFSLARAALPRWLHRGTRRASSERIE